jgi:hypothetical protein
MVIQAAISSKCNFFPKNFQVWTLFSLVFGFHFRFKGLFAIRFDGLYCVRGKRSFSSIQVQILNLPTSPSSLERIIHIPTLLHNTRARLLPHRAIAFNLVRRVRARSHQQVLYNPPARFARGRLQQSALRDVELHCFGG